MKVTEKQIAEMWLWYCKNVDKCEYCKKRLPTVDFERNLALWGSTPQYVKVCIECYEENKQC